MNLEFRLLETMKVKDGEIRLLARHLERLSASARNFHFLCDLNTIRSSIQEAAASQRDPKVMRLLLSHTGKWELQLNPMPTCNPTTLRVPPVIVNSEDEMLRHKNTARDIYIRARAGMDEATDGLLTNERGEITESTIANVAVKREGVWITPRVSCGLLPGTLRAQLLDDGEIQEGIVRLEHIAPGESIRCFNAVRGIWEARLIL